MEARFTVLIGLEGTRWLAMTLVSSPILRTRWSALSSTMVVWWCQARNYGEAGELSVLEQRRSVFARLESNLKFRGDRFCHSANACRRRFPSTVETENTFCPFSLAPERIL